MDHFDVKELKNSGSRIVNGILDFLAEIPSSNQPKVIDKPEEKCRKITKDASINAAMISGSLAIPIGPLGIATVLPDLISIWKIQAQLIVDIAAVYGKDALILREQMLYCLFRHTASQAFRDFVVRAGERVFVKQVSLSATRSLLEKIGVKISQQLGGKAASRWLPIVGAAGVAFYSFYDTTQVGKTAVTIYKEIVDDNSSTSAAA
ncbi:MAG: hypothetical protein DKM50_07540 [Candidatus Margulisiibacteriota bacterium]|nr:MAG: hypothetical protein A2X43_13620 [Candidatus Margulisbacteria bacterium GWD2_39_127]PZM79743.1 MAG: hypothetical protein DKM50_07540 [Candidatus Margulisiibacteriota bacterium]HAR62138.1 hypothetical protein [Candidatus Margulisiibacteriota bacterium]HCY36695.1 hypothetical protein [Candidatus Margulisiibacteriota bacterium]